MILPLPIDLRFICKLVQPYNKIRRCLYSYFLYIYKVKHNFCLPVGALSAISLESCQKLKTAIYFVVGGLSHTRTSICMLLQTYVPLSLKTVSFHVLSLPYESVLGAVIERQDMSKLCVFSFLFSSSRAHSAIMPNFSTKTPTS